MRSKSILRRLRYLEPDFIGNNQDLPLRFIVPARFDIRPQSGYNLKDVNDGKCA